jgi:hypothetical protein
VGPVAGFRLIIEDVADTAVVDLFLDVTDVAGLGEPASVAATVHLPDPAEMADPAVVCFANPGGGYSKGYYTVDLPGPSAARRLTGTPVAVSVPLPAARIHRGCATFPAQLRQPTCCGCRPRRTPLFYLMVATRSGVIAASWGAQLDQPWSPFKGKSKCPFEPARLRYCA